MIMHNLVLSPIDPEILIKDIADRVTTNILNAVGKGETTALTDLLTVQQAAEFLSLSVPTIYAKISNKELPCMKRSKRVYFSREDLLSYLRAGRKRTIAEIEAGANNVLKPLKKRGASYE